MASSFDRVEVTESWLPSLMGSLMSTEWIDAVPKRGWVAGIRRWLACRLDPGTEPVVQRSFHNVLPRLPFKAVEGKSYDYEREND